MKLAFKRTDDLFSNLINAWTGFTGFGHVELVNSHGISFSSVPEGVRFAKIDYEKTGDDYCFVEFDPEKLFGLSEKEIWNNARKILGAPYDWAGIFLYEFLPFNLQDPKKFWCSESIRKVLEWLSFQVSPNRLYRDILKLKIQHP